MATNILMPALSPTMTEGNLARWLKQEGDRIKAGDVIAEIETDKATMEVEAVDEGILGRILVPAGTQGVKVNDVIAVLVEAGEAVPAAGAAPQAAPVAAPAPAMPAPVAAAPAPAPASGDRVFASPLARRMAAQAGLDIGKIAGSGPNGRIVKADVDAARSRGPAPVAAAAPIAAPAPVAAPRPAASVAITAPHTAVPNSSIRKVIARRLAESKATIPHFYVSTDVEIDALLKIRADLNARSPKDGPGAYKLSVNDLVIKATAVTLRRFPSVNAMWTEDAILQLHDVDISVAVSIPDGLITPIVKGADIKGLAAISNEMKDLAARAKTGKLKPEEFQGGGFSISNMGMYGVKDFAAIINPPQAGILAVSAGEQRPVVKNGALAIATVMTLTLSVDHRVIDGALAAEFLQALKRNIEDPLSLML
ncbi:MAG: pyruvate dehydrogenase complex dihydrolipoamide acetyltransferase [Roseomonas sp.]|nr:pyruvate dehydrogenase complex dihydrolipoamide acetyltransferase [Roseomonas sp.]MCA3327910.1 pyruvate dehydrogenase complex dihydrolipoamide acetyltransferase [Roseomonas sp.]MCA3331702.1 pyruvate dehydrogenase complex dihydrolipoamide acetyltransferase [Roseomonas sp.]MCA3333279.1 pyruvate dehydrogenase complex dihydrolipoamide acetyltransferase [Roseomonas sp.]MCA3348129.1 pyruvate dehydrogenase complex dihydrolipoamide acetyltransferase [Roseomonas sp.]